MPTLGKYKNVLLAITFGCLLYLGYMFFWPADDGSALVSTTGDGNGLDVDRDLIELLSKIKQIRLDATLFESDVFNSLEDYSQIIPPEAVGRSNPFAPIGQ